MSLKTVAVLPMAGDAVSVAHAHDAGWGGERRTVGGGRAGERAKPARVVGGALSTSALAT